MSGRLSIILAKSTVELRVLSGKSRPFLCFQVKNPVLRILRDHFRNNLLAGVVVVSGAEIPTKFLGVCSLVLQNICCASFWPFLWDGGSGAGSSRFKHMDWGP